MKELTVSSCFEEPGKIAEKLIYGLGDAAGVELGVLMCSAVVDHAAVLKKVSSAVNFPIIGRTALAVFDYYGFCEFVPTLDKSGKIINRSHSASIAMCVF